MLKYLLCFAILINLIFRFWNLDGLPNGFFYDESAVGYNAFTISEAGIDQYGNKYPVFFRALDDYKNPIYIYFLSGLLHFFELDEWSTRFPAALFGLATILLAFLIARKLYGSVEAGLWAALLVAYNPLHLHFSRIAWQALTITVFFPIAFLLFIYAYNKSSKYLAFFTGLALGISLYTYTTAKVLAFVFFLICLVLFFRKMKSLVVCYLLGLALFGLPYTIEFFAYYEEVNLRFEFIKLPPSEYISAYLSHWSPNFLFLQGDQNYLHGDGKGIIQWYLAPLLILGLLNVFKSKNRNLYLLLFLTLFMPLLGSLTVDYPHPTRVISWVPFLHLLAAGGLVFIATHFKKQYATYLVLALILVTSSFRIYDYVTKYPIKSKIAWAPGLLDSLRECNHLRKPNEQVVHYRMYIDWLFANKVPAETIVKNADQLQRYSRTYDFSDKLGKYSFLNTCHILDCKNKSGRNQIWSIPNMNIHQFSKYDYDLLHESKEFSIIRLRHSQ